ncbi:MAG TPA: carbohydrate-binding protein [Thermoanaerobaculia bacterium]|nr:carbohydrate-binding protein [Thermoanaerobaculia bacterium]
MHRLSVFLVSILLALPLFAARSPFLGAPVNLPGTVQAENYDNGGEGVAYHDTSPGNAFGPVYRTEDVDIGQITAGGYHIGALANGEWTEYTVNVATTGPYNVTIRYSSATTLTTSFRLLLNGVDVSGSIPITSSGDWQNYVTKVVSVNLTAGSSKILRVSFDVGAFNLDSLAFAAGCVAPAITTQPTNKTPTTGQTITLTAAASGTTLSYQWLKNGAAIPGATSTSLTLAGVEQWKDGGNYQLRASNSCGTATSNIAVVRVSCNADGPDEGTENINRALRGLGDLCDWSADVNTSFPYNFGNGQSYNLPVLTAATAFIKEPVRPGVWNMNTWWTDYLMGELGDRGTAWYYGGQELGSYNYQPYNEAAILAVHYQANLVGNTTVRDLARRWLRATIALHALAASPGPVQSLHAKGQQVGGVSYNGPYVGFAGMRSSWGFWNSVDRSIIMSQALGRVTNRSGEFFSQKNIREWVEPRWTGPNGNVYGMTSTDQADLNAAINSATLPANFVTRFLGTNLRTQVRYHVVAWSGVKVTLMETNTNGNTVPTYGVAYFAAPRLASGQEAHFLYPWQGLFMPADRRHRNGVTAGWGAIDVTSATSRYIQASNAPGSTTHPLETVTIDNLPLSARSYWLVLSPSAAPALQ